MTRQVAAYHRTRQPDAAPAVDIHDLTAVRRPVDLVQDGAFTRCMACQRLSAYSARSSALWTRFNAFCTFWLRLHSASRSSGFCAADCASRALALSSANAAPWIRLAGGFELFSHSHHAVQLWPQVGRRL
jgi:hypothetical protein